MKKQKGHIQILAILFLIIGLVSALYLAQQRANIWPKAASPASQPSQAIQNDTDLMNVEKRLDDTDIDGAMDPELKQNDADMQSFAPRIRLKNGSSLNWSGYAVETSLSNPQSNAVSDVKGSWVVPTVSCTGVTTNTYSAAWVGIDGYSDNTVEQTGTEHDCVNGSARYSAWYEMYPKPSFRVNLPVQAGNIMSAEVQYVGNKFVLTLKNVTTGQTFTTTQKSNGQRQSAEWVMEAPWSGSVLPLANFGTIAFSSASATLNNHAGTVKDFPSDQITMTDSSGNPKASPSALSTDGGSFTVTWKAN